MTRAAQLMNTTDVENYPGFPDGVIGPGPDGGLRKQAERFGAELITDDVVEVGPRAVRSSASWTATTTCTSPAP